LIRQGSGYVLNPDLTPVTGLESRTSRGVHAPSGTARVSLCVRTGVSICHVLAREGAENQLASRVLELYGISLPHLFGPGARNG
jgi:hypothetical protein